MRLLAPNPNPNPNPNPYAYEVLLLAVPLINVAFGPMTSSLLKAGNFPLCGELQKIYPEETTCFQAHGLPPEAPLHDTYMCACMACMACTRACI